MTTATAPISAAPAAVGVKESQPRLHMIDAMRYIAALCIIWDHVPRSPQLASTYGLWRFAVPFFTLSAVFFVINGVRRHPERGFGPYTATRFTRIYIPFAVWTVIYLLLKDAGRLLHPSNWHDIFQPTLLLAGSAGHLWYLPFILVVCLFLFPLARWLTARPRGIAPAIVCLLAGAIIALIPRPESMTVWGPSISQQTAFTLGLWWAALPSVFWGIPFAMAYERWSGRGMRRPVVVWSGLIVALACVACVHFYGRNILLENIAGIGAGLFALATWDGPRVRKLASFGALAYGVYLIHLAFVLGFFSVAGKLHIPDAWWLDIGIFAVTAALATGIIRFLSRWKQLWWVTG